LNGHTQKVWNGLFFANDKLIVSSCESEYTVRIWNAETFQPVG